MARKWGGSGLRSPSPSSTSFSPLCFFKILFPVFLPFLPFFQPLKKKKSLLLAFLPSSSSFPLLRPSPPHPILLPFTLPTFCNPFLPICQPPPFFQLHSLTSPSLTPTLSSTPPLPFCCLPRKTCKLWEETSTLNLVPELELNASVLECIPSRNQTAERTG